MRDVSTLLNVPTVIVLDAQGSYITPSAVLGGLKAYRADNTIKGVILNRLGSQSHYELIKNRIESDFDDVAVLGWVRDGLDALRDTHLGLDLRDRDKLAAISAQALEHIDIDALIALGRSDAPAAKGYPFPPPPRSEDAVAVVCDENFSFLYPDNLRFLEEAFSSVCLVSPSCDEPIPDTCKSVYICGGYVETDAAYETLRNARRFKDSLIPPCVGKSTPNARGSSTGGQTGRRQRDGGFWTSLYPRKEVPADGILHQRSGDQRACVPLPPSPRHRRGIR